MEIGDKIALELFGGFPAGNIFGMPVFVDPRMPDDRIRFVDPVSGRFTDMLLPGD